MEKGIDYVGITVSFRCHDGAGNYVMHRRSENCRDEHGCWDFGGGGLHVGETLEDCLRREVKEEHNADVQSFEYMGHKEMFREHEGRQTHWIRFAYRALVDRDEVTNNEPDKHEEVQWFTMDNLPGPLHSQIIPDNQQFDFN